jgi:hypothetical protein
VYPQPADTVLYIVYGSDAAGQAKINIYNSAGSLVAQVDDAASVSSSNLAVIDLSKFSPGVYYYIIKLAGVQFKPGKFLVSK